jgi:hypothetical protein
VEGEVGLDGGRWGEGVDVDGGVWGADAGAASGALGEAGVCPGEVEVDDDAGVLEVDPFGEEVGGEQEADGVVGWWRVAAVGAGGEAVEGVLAGDGAAGDAGVASGEESDAGDVGEGAVEGLDGLGELREGNHRGGGVLVEDVAEGLGAEGVGGGGAGVVFGEVGEGVEVVAEGVVEGCGVRGVRGVGGVGGGVVGEEFGEGELHVVLADEPGAEFGAGGVSSGVEGLSEGFAFAASLAEGVGEGGVAGAPGAEEPEPDEGAGDGAVVCGERGGEGEEEGEGFGVVGEGVWGVGGDGGGEV